MGCVAAASILIDASERRLFSPGLPAPRRKRLAYPLHIAAVVMVDPFQLWFKGVKLSRTEAVG